MTITRLLKVFAALAAVLASTAAWLWYTTGEPPDRRLIHAAVGMVVAALITAVVGSETRPRLMLRFMAALFALVALMAFAADLSRQSASGGSFESFSLLQDLQLLAPSLAAAIERGVSHAFDPFVWDPVLTSVLSLPASLTFLGLAIIAGMAGRPRQRVRIFVNDF